MIQSLSISEAQDGEDMDQFEIVVIFMQFHAPESKDQGHIVLLLHKLNLKT